MHVPEPPNTANDNYEMLARYRRRQSRLYRTLRAPLPLVYNHGERHLPPCEGVKLWIGECLASKSQKAESSFRIRRLNDDLIVRLELPANHSGHEK